MTRQETRVRFYNTRNQLCTVWTSKQNRKDQRRSWGRKVRREKERWGLPASNSIQTKSALSSRWTDRKHDWPATPALWSAAIDIEQLLRLTWPAVARLAVCCPLKNVTSSAVFSLPTDQPNEMCQRLTCCQMWCWFKMSENQSDLRYAPLLKCVFKHH